MFSKDFFPTPDDVIDQMLVDLDIKAASVLEPSAGKGNIVDKLNERGAKQVLAFEKSKELAKIVEQKSNLLGRDFLKCSPEQISHIDYIVMNPPFSADEKHILHAWEVGPEGCEIVALCNYNTIKENYTKQRKRLVNTIRNYGTYESIGNAFSTAERKTDVEVALVRLFKPAVSEGFDYEGFFLDDEPERDYPKGIITHNEVRSVVSRYVSAVKCFDEFERVSKKMNELVKPIGLDQGFKFHFGYDDTVTTKEQFARQLQRKSWEHLFRKMNLDKFVTSGVMKDINKFTEQQSKYPFTMKNVYRMLEIIIGTRQQTMERALEEAFNKITEHYHENRFFVEGWKTNSHYLVNEKFILPYMVEEGFGGQMRTKYSSYGNTEKLTDLQKALCWLTGTENEAGDLSIFREDEDGNDLQFHTWYDWGFFKIKGFKKGTLHCKFNDKDVWELFNRRIAEIKGHPLPEGVEAS